MNMTPTEPEPSAEEEDAPEQLDADVYRAVLHTAETCRERFDQNPSRSAYQLGVILEALGRYPHLIDPVHRFMESDKCPSKTGAAPVVAIGGVPVRRPVVTKDGSVVYQKIRGRSWEGPSMVARTRSAIAAYDADPLDVAAAVIRDLPPLLKADCRKYAEMDAERVGLAIAHLLDENLRSALIANRGDSVATNLNYALLVANPEIVANIERADRANSDLLDAPQWKKIPEQVLRAILRELGHPRPGNLTRD